MKLWLNYSTYIVTKVVVVDKKGVFHRSPLLGTVSIPLDNPGLSQVRKNTFKFQLEQKYTYEYQHSRVYDREGAN